MPKPFTRNQQLQNAAFLKTLERTGNVRLAARECRLNHTTMRSRRKRHPAFAQRWDAALAMAEARLRDTAPFRPASRTTSPVNGKGRGNAFRTKGGEAVTVLLANGRVQVRRARAGRVTQAALQAFLLALAATANMALAAASVGINPSAIHRRRRRDPAFAREVLAALAQGYERVEMALLESWMPDDAEDAQWRDNEPPAIPPMTNTQAVQMLYLRQKQVRWREAELPRRCFPGEASDQRSAKLARLYRAKLVERAENEGSAWIANEAPGPHEPPPIVLPDLGQVTGWSRADPAKGAHGDAALFGGWRIRDMDAHAAAPREAARGRAGGGGAGGGGRAGGDAAAAGRGIAEGGASGEARTEKRAILMDPFPSDSFPRRLVPCPRACDG